MKSIYYPQANTNQDNNSYNCKTCQINPSSEAEFKSHFKSEYHQYNVKRKIVGLSTVSNEKFQKMIQNKALFCQQQVENVAQKCNICNKTFQSKNTYSQHLESKKHQLKVQNPPTKETKNFKNSESSTLDDISICLFCNQQNASLIDNISHMNSHHSFFISDQTYCKDFSELLIYLAEKINIGKLCLLCDTQKEFKTASAVRNHMIDKGHCFMQSKSMGEYSKFYDFSSKIKSFNDENQDEEIIIQQENSTNSTSKDSWDLISEKSQEQRDHFRKQVYHFSKKEPLKKLNMKNFLVKETGEIVLKGGKRIGNRLYNQHYKQYYRQLYIKAQIQQNQLTNGDKDVIITSNLSTYEKILQRRNMRTTIKVCERANAKLIKHHEG